MPNFRVAAKQKGRTTFATIPSPSTLLTKRCGLSEGRLFQKQVLAVLCGGNGDFGMCVRRCEDTNDVYFRVRNQGLPVRRPSRDAHPLSEHFQAVGRATGNGVKAHFRQPAESVQHECPKRSVTDGCHPHLPSKGRPNHLPVRCHKTNFKRAKVAS